MTRVKQINKRNSSKLKNIFLICLFIFIGLFLFMIAGFAAFAYQINQDMQNYNDSIVFNIAQNSRIYAADRETVLAELQIENREPVDSLEEISPNVTKATISIEDARFYQHQGVDLWALIRSAGVILKGGATQGGSTITMQLVRNTILRSQAQTITIERKIGEIILANKIEQIYSKDQILLMYLNTINYGDRCYGIKAASKHYFSCEPSELTVEQAATLAGIPQSPTYLSPSANEQACKKRRDTVLYRMYDDGVITQAEYNRASGTPIELNLSYAEQQNNYQYPYFTNYIRQQVLEKYSSAEIFEGGFQIYTTMDVKHQEACEEGCAKTNKTLEKGAESVAVTMNPQNGYVTGIVGGDNYEKHQFNIATSNGRPTGSSFKVFTLATAIEQGYDPFSYKLDCTSPMKLGDISIENIFGRNYGQKTIQGAMAVSSNTGLVRLQQKVGTENVVNMARKLGIKNADLPAVATLTLGSANVNPIEMACAYSTICNGGIYHEPVTILDIRTASGEQIYYYDEHENPDNGLRVLDQRVCGAITKVLKTVFTEGTATNAKPANGQPVAGKTGTSDSYRDHTLIGYTPNLVLSTWIGKRDYAPTSQNVSCNGLWKSIIDIITKDQKIVDFPNYADPNFSNKSDKIENKTDDEKLNDAPNVVGQSIQQAKATLSEYHLAIYYKYSDIVENGYIISQSTADGRVVLEVSKGKKLT